MTETDFILKTVIGNEFPIYLTAESLIVFREPIGDSYQYTQIPNDLFWHLHKTTVIIDKKFPHLRPLSI